MELGRRWIAPLLAEFAAQHPALEVHVVLSDAGLEVGQDGLDVALRIGRPDDPAIIARTGFTGTRGLYDAYRNCATALGRPAPNDRFAYLALVGVGDTKEEGYRRAHLIGDYSRTTPRTARQFWSPPGYNPLTTSAQGAKSGPDAALGSIFTILGRTGRRIDAMTASVDDFIDAGLMFAGTPDMVYDQIKDFYDTVGGFGHLLMMGQGGHISHEDTIANLTLFSKEVLPRVEALN
jgi:alkanesulfonate monooxygenase SsuD/methylene tetrahydromethanopterin reductase-like flavin-dependent oxidoreductase (luciferase family)